MRLASVPLFLSATIALAQSSARPTFAVSRNTADSKQIIVSGTAIGTGTVAICLLKQPATGPAIDCTNTASIEKGSFKSKPITVGQWTYVTVQQGTVFAGSISPVPSRRSAVVSGSTVNQPDAIIQVDQPYCDTSLPYTYVSGPDSLTMRVGAKPDPKFGPTLDPKLDATTDPNGWPADLQSRLKAAEQGSSLSKLGSPADTKTDVKVVADGGPDLPEPLPFGGLDDPYASNGKVVPHTTTLNDSGDPILPVSGVFSADTYRMQRLLVRTLVGPNVTNAACSFPYVDAPTPPPPPATGGRAPLKDANGQPTNPVGAGSFYRFSINDSQTPQYYLVNIVRWEDAKKPTAPVAAAATTGPGTAPAATVAAPVAAPAMPPAAAYYQVASDDWYLLNYSDNSDHLQDITRWRKFSPTLATSADTLQVLASKRVAFLGIHLAPPAALADSAKPFLGQIAPTEQAWFDNVTLSYKIHAASVQSIQMQDLSTLLTIVADSAGLPAQASGTPTLPESLPEYVETGLSSAPPLNVSTHGKKDPAALALAATLSSLAAEVDKINGELSKTSELALSLLGASLPATQDYGCVPATKLPLFSLYNDAFPPSIGTDEAIQNCLTELVQAEKPDDAKLKFANIAAQKDLANLQAFDMALNSTTALAKILAGLAIEISKVNAEMANISQLSLGLHGAVLPFTKQDYGCVPPKTAPLLTLDTSSTHPYVTLVDKTTVPDCFYRLLTATTPDTAKLALADKSVQTDLKNLQAIDAALNTNAVISLYQGRYGAGLLTGISTLPSALTGTWSADFKAPTPPPVTAPDPVPASSATPQPSSAPGPKPSSAPESTPPAPVKPAVPATSRAGHSGAHGPSAAGDPVGFANIGGELLPIGATGVPELPEAPLSSSKSTSNEGLFGATGATGKTGAPANTGSNGGSGSNGSTGTTGSSAICTVPTAADVAGQATCSHAGATVLDEGRSRFDISVGVGITGYKDVTTKTQTSGTGTVVVPSSVTREDAYGMVDIFIVPENLVNPPRIGIPHVVAALPFAGQVFDKPYFAVAETFNLPKLFSHTSWATNPAFSSLISSLPFKVRPVFGWVYNKESHTAANGTVTRYRSLQPQWAIEISFTDIKDAVKTLSKSSSSGSSGGSSAAK